MSPKDAIIIGTSDDKDNENINRNLQFYENQLVNQNFTIKESCNFNNKETSKLINKIKECLINYTIFLFSEQLDLIFKILSEIFDKKLVENNHVSKILVPNTAKIFQIYDCSNNKNSEYLRIKNVFVLPIDTESIKSIFDTSLSYLDNNDFTIGKHFILKCCYKNGHSQILNNTLKEIIDSIEVIKYCYVNNDTCDSNIILRSSNFVALAKCVTQFKKVIPKDIILNESLDNSFWHYFNILKYEKYVEESLNIIKKCYTDYGPENVFLSFNGGKDCTVLLYLTLYVIKTFYPNYNSPLLCVYMKSKHPFEELEKFIQQCQIIYNLEMVRIGDMSYKQGLLELLEQKPNLKACLMGTRRTDPSAQNLKHFSMTDSDWPQIMRVNPILNWTYTDIWTLLIKCKFPYCKLYDFGYTSLGSTMNTIPNPQLKYQNPETNQECHYPAFKLKDENKERSGRL